MEDISEIICKDSGSELVLLSALVAMSIGHNLSAYEQNLFGNFLQAIGENLCIMSIRKARCKTEIKKLTDEEKENDINLKITNDVLRDDSIKK